jgi:SAM-dependent methyltransferase
MCWRNALADTQTNPTRDRAGAEASAFFEKLWSEGDYWALESSPFEQQRFAKLIDMLGKRRFARALEIGCGAGHFTRMLAQQCDQIVALDISPTAISRAQSTPAVGVEYRVANVMDLDLREQGTWDLIVMTETIYYLGWLYPFFDLAWMTSELHATTRPGGCVLLANTLGGENCSDELLLPPLIHTYRDLFRNVGYAVAKEATFTGEKDGAALQVLMNLLRKGDGA